MNPKLEKHENPDYWELIDLDTGKTLWTNKKQKEPWQDDFNIYLQMVRNAWTDIMNDDDWIKKQEKINNNENLDIRASVTKSCTIYWATEEGWKNKKSKKGKTIDWRQTFAKTLTINKVYKNASNRFNTTSGNTESARKEAIISHLGSESRDNDSSLF
jgi:hypothetical protein